MGIFFAIFQKTFNLQNQNILFWFTIFIFFGILREITLIGSIGSIMNKLKKVSAAEEAKSYEKAMDWEADLIAMRAKSERKAWTIAKVAVGVAVLEAIGLVTLAPMRQTVPVVFTVDKAQGNVEYVGVVDDQQVKGKQELIDKNNITRYVTARESYFYPLLQPDYDLVMTMSSNQVGNDFASLYEGDSARDKKYGKKYELKVDVISVQTNQDETGFTASVRFTKTLHSVEANRDEQPQYYIASIRYEYAPNNLNKLVEKDLIKNPFGFKVVGYRVDPELSPNRPVAQAAVVEPSQQVYVPIQQGGAAVQPQAQQGM